jgi:hypothetical protein
VNFLKHEASEARCQPYAIALLCLVFFQYDGQDYVSNSDVSEVTVTATAGIDVSLQKSSLKQVQHVDCNKCV